MKRQSIYLLTALLLVTVQPVDAAEWWFTPGGVSHHNTSEYRNENNYGAGLLYEQDDEYLTAGYYRNSFDADTLYVGAGAKYPLTDDLKVGALAVLLTGYPDAPVTIALLPTLTIGLGDNLALNFHYIPTVNGAVAFNLLIRLP